MMEGSTQRPNILWIMTDEQRVDSLRCYGNPWAVSPNIDRLAQRGVLFRNTYCQSPVCVASRACMLTGKYAHTCEVFENWYHLNITSWHRRKIAEAVTREVFDARCAEVAKTFPAQLGEAYGSPVHPVSRKWISRFIAQSLYAQELGLLDQGPQHRMFPEMLADAGYRTASIGKLHHGGAQPGFQEVVTQPDLEYAYFFGLRKDFDPYEYNVVFHPDSHLIMGGTFPAPASETSTYKWTSMAIDWLRQEHKEPFLLRLSIHDPHTPVLPPKPFDTLFDPRDMPVPTPNAKEKRSMSRHDLNDDFPNMRSRLTNEELRRAWASYYGLCAFVDQEVGRLLDALAASPHADNTVVVFLSDHGNLMGEHDLHQKENMYDIATHVPFIISWPRKLPQGMVVDSLTQLIDLAPTLFDLTGLPIPNDMDGVSLLPVMRGEIESVHEAVFSELHTQIPEYDWLLGEAPGTLRRSIRKDKWRMSINYPVDPCYGPDGALYNLEADPSELRNLYYDPAYRPVVLALTNDLVAFAESS